MICYGKKPNKSCFHHLTEFLWQDTIQNRTCLENLRVKKNHELMTRLHKKGKQLAETWP